MTYQILKFHSILEEKQGISFIFSFFTFQLTTRIVQMLTNYVIVQRIYGCFNQHVVSLIIPFKNHDVKK